MMLVSWISRMLLRELVHKKYNKGVFFRNGGADINILNTENGTAFQSFK